jgi:CheY-like chemotaxis protein
MMPLPTTPTSFSGPGLRLRVLLIDDEEVLLRALRRSLGRHFDVVTASSGKEAIAMLERGEKFDAILCDLLMPEMTGRDFYRVVAVRFPEVEPAVRFLSGGVFASELRDFIERMPERLLDKPVDVARLVAFLTAAVKTAQAAAAG